MSDGFWMKSSPSPTADRNSAAVAPVRWAKLSARFSAASNGEVGRDSTWARFNPRVDAAEAFNRDSDVGDSAEPALNLRSALRACGAAVKTSVLCLTERWATSTAILNRRAAELSAPSEATMRGALRKVARAAAGERTICLEQSAISKDRMLSGTPA